MPCPHYDIAIIKRSKGMGAVKSAAYQSAENIYSEYDHKKYYNRSKEKELFHKEILLPAHAPPEYADRSTLWNAVEKSEKQWNAQVARRIVVPIPREVPKERHVKLMREYCRNEFVSRGMVADLAIHDKGDGNPHAHILLTMRAMDEDGKWLPKARKVYDLDENGERIRLPSGKGWKSHKERTVDWDEPWNAEKWRRDWADLANRYLEEALLFLCLPEKRGMELFKQGVELHKGWKIIRETESRKKEKVLQRMIDLIGMSYRKANNLDISCEPDEGRGPVDFKLSRGQDITVIEVKLSTNKQYLLGMKRRF